jgi:hypothetical protein
MATEKWSAIGSVVFFALFSALLITVYAQMNNFPKDDEFFKIFQADPKIFMFISIGVGPAGILAAVAYIMSKQYGSKQIGGLIIVGGVILFVGMFVCNSLIGDIPEKYITDIVKFTPLLFMVLSIPVIVVGAYLTKPKKKRPKKEYF